jgi:hypothetical protein
MMMMMMMCLAYTRTIVTYIDTSSYINDDTYVIEFVEGLQ